MVLQHRVVQKEVYSVRLPRMVLGWASAKARGGYIGGAESALGQAKGRDEAIVAIRTI
jgi:hypothetical protein